MVNHHQKVHHYLDDLPIHLKIKPQHKSGWGKIDFYPSDVSLFNTRIFFYITNTGVTHVAVALCGNEVRELASCVADDASSRVNLTIAKYSQSLEFSCNEGVPLVYGEDCARKFGYDISYFVLAEGWEEGSVMYLFPHYAGRHRTTYIYEVFLSFTYHDHRVKWTFKR